MGALRDLSPVLKRMLKNEEGFDVEYWAGRLRRVMESDDDGQEDLFG